MNMKLFFPEVRNPTRTEIQDALDKFYPGCNLLRFDKTVFQPSDSVLNVGVSEEVEELEEKLNSATGKQIEMVEELETLKRDKIVREASRDLAETQVEKLKGLVEDIDFENEETFAAKVATVKESYFKKSVTESADLDPTDVDDGA